MGRSGPDLAWSKCRGVDFVMKGGSGRLEWDKKDGLRQKAGGAEQDCHGLNYKDHSNILKTESSQLKNLRHDHPMHADVTKQPPRCGT